jgi:phospholipase/carboxylesterase
MPRTRRSVPPYSSPSLSAAPSFEVDQATLSTGSFDFPHTLFAPLHYEGGYAYPLIVWLHGRGADQRQLQRIMPQVSMRNYVAVAPCGGNIAGPEQSSIDCYGWLQTDDHIRLAEQRVFDCIELAAQKLNISRKRIFVAGFDCGGTMALRLAMSHPDRFAGVISLCGQFPTGGKPFGNLIAARRLGIFLATGRVSQEYPAEKVCDDLRLLHTAGLSVTLRQYPCGHELPRQVLADIDRWIIDQITPPANPPVDSDAEWSREAE